MTGDRPSLPATARGRETAQQRGALTPSCHQALLCASLPSCSSSLTPETCTCVRDAHSARTAHPIAAETEQGWGSTTHVLGVSDTRKREDPPGWLPDPRARRLCARRLPMKEMPHVRHGPDAAHAGR